MAVNKPKTQKAPKAKNNTTTIKLHNLAERKKTQRKSPNTSTRGATKGLNYYLGEMRKNAKIQIAANKEKAEKEFTPSVKQLRAIKAKSKKK